jgi:hypothetical protein
MNTVNVYRVTVAVPFANNRDHGRSPSYNHCYVPLSYLGAARPLMLPLLRVSLLICTYRTALPLIPD